MYKLVKYTIIVFVFLIVIGAVAFVVMRRPAKAAETSSTPAEVAIDVSVQALKPVTMPDAILLPASVEPVKSVTVSAEIPGKVEWLGAAEGASVKEGQELVRIDRRTLQNGVDLAQVAFNAAETNFKRNEPLHEKGMISVSDFDAARVTLAAARTSLEAAKIALDKSTIKSPASGVLNRKYIEIGEYVSPGRNVFDIVDVSKVKVVVQVPEKDITFVKCGTLMGVMLGTGEDSIVPGVVSYRSVVADVNTRTYRVEVTVDNAQMKLLPGMIVRMVLLRRMIENAIAVPLFTVIPHEGRAVVFVATDDSRASEREVKLGTTDGHNIEVTSGLKAGERLVTEGQRQLRDGQLLNIVKAEGAV